MKVLNVVALVLSLIVTSSCLKAETRQFPYHVGLVLKYEVEQEEMLINRCGGSLISNEFVLTAAHCVDYASEATVYLGSGEIKYFVTRKDFVVFPKFDLETGRNNVALIKIPFTNFTDDIKPVELPESTTPSSSYVGEKVTITGSDPTSTSDIHWISTTVIPNNVCALTYGPYAESSKICTSSVATCLGISGGPLVLESENVQIGVSTYRGCNTNSPALATRITSYLEWIKAHLGGSK